MPTLAEKLTEAEKNWQQFIAQAAYWQGRVETYRELLAGEKPLETHPEFPENGLDPSA